MSDIIVQEFQSLSGNSSVVGFDRCHRPCSGNCSFNPFQGIQVLSAAGGDSVMATLNCFNPFQGIQVLSDPQWRWWT